MRPRHRAGQDRTFEPCAHDHVVVARDERLDEVTDVREVVGVVGVAHDEVAAPRFLEAARVRRAVAAAPLVHDAGAGPRRDRRGVVGRAVVDHEDFADDPHPGERRASLLDAPADAVGFVQARHHDGDEDLLRRGRAAPDCHRGVQYTPSLVPLTGSSRHAPPGMASRTGHFRPSVPASAQEVFDPAVGAASSSPRLRFCAGVRVPSPTSAWNSS